MSENEANIVGKKIVKVEMNVDNDEMSMLDDNGVLHWLSATGDCCSKSWFEHVSIPKLPFVVNEEIEIRYDFDPKVENGDDEVLKTYALKFKTSAGTLDVELRNQSNGYYGGEIEYSVSPPVDKYGHKHDPGKMRDISEVGL